MPHRLATLAVALAVATSVLAQAEKKEAAAPKKDEPGPVTVDAETIEGVGDLEITARGAAEIKRDELSIFGEQLRYNREFGRVEGDGGVRLQSGLARFFGPHLEYNTLDDTGFVETPRYIIEGELSAHGSAERIEFLGKDKYRMVNGRFTTCAPGREDWRIEADELDLNYETAEGRAKHPRLRFFEKTILTAPFAVSFPLENSRKSGILTPYYSHTTLRGLEVGVPYYWNIAPEHDATITPVFMTRRGLQAKNEFRYLDRSYRGEARFEYMPNDPVMGTSRQGLTLQHAQTFRPNFTGQLDYNRVSDNRYFVDLASQVRQVSQGNLQQDGYVTYTGTLGAAPYTMQARVQKFQTLQDPLAPIVPPYHRVPQLNFSAGYNNLAGFLDSTVPAEFVHFTHSSLVDGARTSFSPTFAAPKLAPGWFFTPKAGWRYAAYNLQHTTPDQAETPRMSVPWASLDSGLIFERDARWFGENVTNTLEPRLFYVYVPFRNQDQIPLFDTTLADFNYPQLFSENRFVGGDRFGDANQATLALTSRLLNATGQEALRATVGQRYYFSDERVGLTPTSTLRTSHSSDMLASVGGRLFRYWTFDTTTQYNRQESRAERYTIATRYQPEVAKVLNASYRYSRTTDPQIRQIDISGQWPVRPGWYAIGRYNYSLIDKRLLEGIAGVEYNAGCWVLRAAVQRIQAAAQVASTGFFIQLEFTGVGQIGTDEVVTLLRRNVPGYSVTNPRNQDLVPPGVQRPLPFQQVF